MSLLEAVILGLIQGLTEFLPISSSGHLVLGKEILGLRMPGVSFEIWLHLGTLLAVLIYFREKIIKLLCSALIFAKASDEEKLNRRLLKAIIAGTVPAVVVGIGMKTAIEQAFSSPRLAAGMLMVTGVILLLSHWSINRARQVGVGRGFIVGWAQAVAILPGVSRSGSTIAAAMFLGVEPSLAAEFSFLLAIPAIGGAFLLDLVSSGTGLFASAQLPNYLAGTLVAFTIGYLSIYSLLKIVRRGRFYLFGLYCLVAGTISFILLP